MKGFLPEAFFSLLIDSLMEDSLFFESNSSPCSIIPNGMSLGRRTSAVASKLALYRVFSSSRTFPGQLWDSRSSTDSDDRRSFGAFFCSALRLRKKSASSFISSFLCLRGGMWTRTTLSL